MKYKLVLERDKKLRDLLIDNDFELKFENNIPLKLIQSIISQQLSTKVADIILKRFLNLFKNNKPSLQEIINTPIETYRSIGLSNAKAFYTINVATFCLENNISFKLLLNKSNEEVIDLLTQIKGVGKWTVEMLLMFALGREDVFSVDDLGIQQAMCKIYQIDNSNKKEMKIKMLQIADKWKPYRTFACLHLWKFKDTKE